MVTYMQENESKDFRYKKVFMEDIFFFSDNLLGK